MNSFRKREKWRSKESRAENICHLKHISQEHIGEESSKFQNPMNKDKDPNQGTIVGLGSGSHEKHCSVEKLDEGSWDMEQQWVDGLIYVRKAKGEQNGSELSPQKLPQQEKSKCVKSNRSMEFHILSAIKSFKNRNKQKHLRVRSGDHGTHLTTGDSFRGDHAPYDKIATDYTETTNKKMLRSKCILKYDMYQNKYNRDLMVKELSDSAKKLDMVNQSAMDLCILLESCLELNSDENSQLSSVGNNIADHSLNHSFEQTQDNAFNNVKTGQSQQVTKSCTNSLIVNKDFYVNMKDAKNDVDVEQLLKTMSINYFKRIKDNNQYTNSVRLVKIEREEDGGEMEETLSVADAVVCSKYSSFIKAGLPSWAVCDKMFEDGIESKLVDKVIGWRIEVDDCMLEKETFDSENASHGTLSSSTTSSIPSSLVSTQHLYSGDVCKNCGKCTLSSERTVGLSVEDEVKVSKYRGMLKAGVPEMAVRHKMAGDGISQVLLDKMFSGGEGSKSSIIKKKQASKFLTLHWTPITLSKDHLNDTVFSPPNNLILQSRKTSKHRQENLLYVEKYFSKKKSTKIVKAPISGDVLGKSEVSAGGRKSFLDATRIQNISIGMRTFKHIIHSSSRKDTKSESPQYQAIGEAVGSLNMSVFTPDQLICLGEMLPSDIEIKEVKKLAESLEKEAKKISKCDVSSQQLSLIVMGQLQPCELFCYGFSTYKRVKQKVDVLKFISSFDHLKEELSCIFTILQNSFHQVLSSEKLSLLLHEVIKLGNILNDGTSKGDAQGITADSLLKLNETKSTCRKLTFLDYLVELILKDDMVETETNDAENRSGDKLEEGTLMQSRCALSSAQSREREDYSILDFMDDMPDIAKGIRHPISEVCVMVREVVSGLIATKKEFQKMKLEGNEQPTAAELEYKGMKAEFDKHVVPPTVTCEEILRTENTSTCMTSCSSNSETKTCTTVVTCSSYTEKVIQQTSTVTSHEVNDHYQQKPAPSLSFESLEKKTIGAAPTCDPLLQIDQFICVAQQQVDSIELELDEIKVLSTRLIHFFGNHTGQDAGSILDCLLKFGDLVEMSRKKVMNKIELEKKIWDRLK